MKIFSDVVVAVGRLHHRTKPIIHRDLKVQLVVTTVLVYVPDQTVTYVFV